MSKETPFADFGFYKDLNSALEKIQFVNSTPIQAEAIPLILKGNDVSGLAQTGTGKTAAFLLPMIERIMRSQQEDPLEEDLASRKIEGWTDKSFALVLVPTRELAEQVKDRAVTFLADSENRCAAVYGGVSIEKQIQQLEKGVTFLVATPGRLIDLFKQHKVDLKQCKAVIFDEADRMFDMGFKDDMKYILRRIPEDRQLLLFSATLNLDVFNVAYQFGSNPVELNVSIDKATADNVEDFIFHLGRDEKASHLLGLMKKLEPKQVIIFTNFKNQVDRISEFLTRNGYPALGISSLINQNQRKSVMNKFRAEDGANILVATDVAARGLDIKGVDLVVNFELPDDAENYVHRIGRTGRAGATGKAYSFVSDKDVEALGRIHNYLHREITTEWMEDEDIPTDFKEFPRGDLFSKKKRFDGNRGGRPGDRRDSRKGRGGPSSRGSRGGESNKRRNERRPRRGRKPEGEEEELQDKRSAQGRPHGGKKVHRDKARGRHKAAKGKIEEHSKGKSSSKKRAQSAPAKSRQKYKTAAPTGRRQSSTKPQESTGLMKKVGSALRGLFGG